MVCEAWWPGVPVWQHLRGPVRQGQRHHHIQGNQQTTQLENSAFQLCYSLNAHNDAIIENILFSIQEKWAYLILYYN